MEWYYQMMEQLAEWFMQLFFDPAYHMVREEKVQNLIIKKQQVVSDWWVKQKEMLNNFQNQMEPKAENKLFEKFNEWISSVIMSSPIGYYLNYKWVELIQ